jgi:class 3 adenylate cyclase
VNEERLPRDGRLTTATVLVCDLVSSTQQRTTLGDDAADRLAVWLDETLRAAVARSHGRVVKSTGDGLMAVFDAATDALNTAVAVQQATEGRNARVPALEHLVLRIGVSAGDVHFVAHDCHGTPVVEAARLESAAEPGSIFVSALVRSLVGSRGSHTFDRVGALELKGLAGPVETFRVAWEPAIDAGLPEPTPTARAPFRVALPDRLAVRPSVGVIGYDAEQEVMANAANRVAAGEGREVILVSGEAGLGKTTIAAAAARTAFADGACVLFGHCEEDLATPYQLFAEAFGHYVAHAPEGRLRAHVEAYGSELTRVVPALARRLPGLPPSKATDADTERFLLFAAAVGLLTAISEQQPVVLVLDDLQWADEASLMLVDHIVAGQPAVRLLLVGIFRDDEVAHARALRETLGELQRHPGVTRLELRGFDNADVVALMETLAGYPLGDDEVGLADAVYRETDGNPFFVNQVLRHLVETGALYQDSSGHWAAQGSLAQVALPDSVREVVGGRVVRLGESAERALTLAAVIGRDFDLELLSETATSSEEELIDMLDAASRAALVREERDTPGSYHFAHALIQHTLYQDLGPTRRARAHRQVAEALEELCAGRPGTRVGELARHWTNTATPEGLVKAIGYSRQAGDAALDALAPSDALLAYTQALDLVAEAGPRDPVLVIDLAIGLGTAQRQVGQPAFRETLLGAARQAIALGDTPRLVAAALAAHRGLFSNFGAIDRERVAIFEAALAQVPAADPDRALILATYCLEIVVGSTLERRQELADEALAIADATGDDAVIVRVLNNVAYALMSPPMLEQSLLRTADALERAARVGDPVLHFFAANWRRQACAQAGELAEMDRCTEVMDGLTHQLNQPMLSWVHIFGLAWLAIIRGDTEAAERFAGEALEIGTTSGQPDAEFIYGGQLMIIHHQRGGLDQLRELMEEMAAGTPSLAGVLSGALAIGAMESSRPDDARRRLETFAENGFELEMNPVWITGMVFFADAAIELGDPAFAGPLYERLAPWGDQWSDNGATAANPICHYLGGLASVLGRDDDADAFFARSATMCRGIGAQFFLAQTELLWGRMLARRGRTEDHDRAHELLEQARSSAIAKGYASVLGRADEAIRLLGA